MSGFKNIMNPAYQDNYESKSVPNFKGFEALQCNVLDIDDQLLCYDV